MRRREFIAGLGGVVAWPLAVRAQQPSMPVVGFLHHATAAAIANRVAAFRQGLNEAGFIEGRNVTIEFRWAENQLDRLSGLAADLVRRQVTVITANATATLSAKSVTTTIPIVFVSGDDPGDSGLITNLSRPGGNLTGVSFSNGPLNPKRFQLLHELVPKSSTIGVIFDPNSPTPDARLRDIEAGAHMLGRDILILKAGTENEVNAAFVTITQAGAGALFVAASQSFIGRRRQITALALRHGLPASYPTREFAEIGGLMSYGASPTDAYRRGGIYVSRILRGEKAGDLPVELPTKYELVVNIATAKALGLTIPETLLATADQVIE